MPTTESDSQGLTSQEREEVKDKARWLRRIVNPYLDLYIILSIGAAGTSTLAEAAQGRGVDKQIRDHAKELTPIQRAIYSEDFVQITTNLPFLKRRLESDDPSRVIRKIAHEVQSIADQAKQSDTKGIKNDIILFIPKKYLPPNEDGSAAVSVHQAVGVTNPSASKSWRGWANVVTARLLCPVDCITKFKADPHDTVMKLRQGELLLIDNAGDPKFPAFLYDEDTMNTSLTQGLFHGPLLLAVYRHIFISPTAATGAKASSKRGNAKIHGMEEVLPSTICYAAIHAYVALSSMKMWGEEWKGVKLTRLYLLLREQFAYPDDPWCTETLKWWNEKMFSNPPRTDKGSPEPMRDTQGLSVREHMENERQERLRTSAEG